ncbi:hypothetical protein FORC81_p487 (plasmid) [Escherichia coli]|nr:hypothetical protein FORC81_p487 [Escherichia coli]
MLLIQLRKNAPKQVVFNIRDLTRTTDQYSRRKHVKTRKTACFLPPKLAVFGVAGCYQNDGYDFSQQTG